MIIDSHHHLWQIGQHDHSWPTPDLAKIYHDFLMPDLHLASAGTGLSGTIVVQSQPSLNDTKWLLEVAANDPFIKGVVGWVDMASPDAVDTIKALALHPKLRSLRPMLQGLEDDDWILRPDVQPALKAMTELDLCLDALVFTRHLAAIKKIAQTYPTLKIVIDHGAKPPIGGPEDQVNFWRAQMAEMARFETVYVKLSGLATEMTDYSRPALMAPFVAHILEHFGPQKTMWGSDWPVINLRSDYADWLSWLTQTIDHLGEPAKQMIFAKTAQDFYRLD